MFLYKYSYLQLGMGYDQKIWTARAAFEEESVEYFSIDCGDTITAWSRDFDEPPHL